MGRKTIKKNNGMVTLAVRVGAASGWSLREEEGIMFGQRTQEKKERGNL
jgi:hypothetical protein